MSSEEPPAPSPPDTPLGERLARLEGLVQAEDKLLEAQDRLLEHGLESSNKVQTFIIALVGLLVAAAVALLVYLLQRLDAIATISAAAHK